MVIRAPRLEKLGFLHGFSTRVGGESEGPYASNNLARGVGDDEAVVDRNRKAFAREVGFVVGQLFEVHQVHRASVVTVYGGDRPDDVRREQADALVSSVPGVALGVRVADCVPLLLAHPRTGAVAAVHAGWRGVVAEVPSEAVKALGVPPEELYAVLGPSIGPCCFEVGPEVASELAQAAGDGVVLPRANGRPHVDLWRAVEHQLRRRGLRTVDTMGLCTVCDTERFFSFRRDGRPMGQHLAVIVSKAAAG